MVNTRAGIGRNSLQQGALQEETQLFVISRKLKDWDEGVLEKMTLKSRRAWLGNQPWTGGSSDDASESPGEMFDKENWYLCWRGVTFYFLSLPCLRESRITHTVQERLFITEW